MNVQMLSGIMRHVMTAIGGVLVTTGVMDAGDVELVIGAAVTIVGVVWSVWEKKNA